MSPPVVSAFPLHKFACRFASLVLLLVTCACTLPVRAVGQVSIAADAEVQRCEERIATVRREILNRYDDALKELQSGFQKAADLDGAVAVRSERQRVMAEGNLVEKNYVIDPKNLRTLQAQMLGKIQDLTAQVVTESLPKLVEARRNLTVAGKLDEAIAVRDAIERLQNAYLPIVRPDSTTTVSADTILQSYAADRSRAEKTYKGQKFVVRGVLGGYRPDPADSKVYQVFLTAAAPSAGWVQCSISLSDYRLREEKLFNGTFLTVTAKDEGSIRWQKGQTIDLRGTCEGWDETVRFSRCELVR